MLEKGSAGRAGYQTEIEDKGLLHFILVLHFLTGCARHSVFPCVMSDVGNFLTGCSRHSTIFRALCVKIISRARWCFGDRSGSVIFRWDAQRIMRFSTCEA